MAEHSFGSLWVDVISQIMARERMQLTSWNLASEKYADNQKYEYECRAKLIKLRKRHLIVKQHFYKSFGKQ